MQLIAWMSVITIIGFAYLIFGNYILSSFIVVSKHKENTQIGFRNVKTFENDIHNKFEKDIHIIYNIGCGGNSNYVTQLIESLALDYTWRKVQQVGKLTRIVSGCETNSEEDIYLRKIMSQTLLTEEKYLKRFNVLFVPKSENIKGDKKQKYVMQNRPTAILKFFKMIKSSADYLNKENTIFIVLDPDFIFLKPFSIQAINQVKSNRPAAGYYMMHDNWKHWGIDFCVNFLKESAQKCERKYAHLNPRINRKHYYAGAPYLMLLDDWLNFIPKWLSTIPFVYNKYYNGIEADMFAYMIASVEAGLNHSIITTFQNTCMMDLKKFSKSDTFIHYCMRYHTLETREEKLKINKLEEFILDRKRVEKFSKISNFTYTFSKYWMLNRGRQKALILCESPLLIPPPNFHSTLLGDIRFKNEYDILSIVVATINNALSDYKKKICFEAPNLKKQVYLHESHKITNYKLFSIMNDI